jgi:hypothetical protein
MHRAIKRFVKRGKDITSGVNKISVPPAVQLDRIMNQVERIQKLEYVTEVEKNEGIRLLWAMYNKVQLKLLDKRYTADETWGNAKHGNANSPVPGQYSPKNNEEVDFSTYGDSFEGVIDSTLMPDARTKIKNSGDL